MQMCGGCGFEYRTVCSSSTDVRQWTWTPSAQSSHSNTAVSYPYSFQRIISIWSIHNILISSWKETTSYFRTVSFGVSIATCPCSRSINKSLTVKQKLPVNHHHKIQTLIDWLIRLAEEIRIILYAANKSNNDERARTTSTRKWSFHWCLLRLFSE